LLGGCAGAAAPKGALAPAPAAEDEPRLVVANAFIASFSPDGAALAYGLDPDNSGIAVRDLRTGATRTLSIHGKVPAWSPDGKTIAYVVGPASKGFEEEAVWVMGSDGSGAIRVMQHAGMPSWSADGRSVIVHARKESRLVAIPLSGAGAGTAALFYDGPLALTPAISPDERQIAVGRDQELQVFDRQTKQKVFAWPTPGATNLTAAWSPDGKRLAFAGAMGIPIGLWVIDLDRKKAVQVAVGSYLRPVWSPEGRTLVFDLREGKRKALWRVGRAFVDRCLDRAAVAESELGFGAGVCPEALRMPAEP
jgi:Tol biopolymer transport system component